jgi:hypothetical protein
MASEIQNDGQFSMGCNFFATEYFFNRFSALCLFKNGKKIMEVMAKEPFLTNPSGE